MTKYICGCGADLAHYVDEELLMARIGQPRITITCPLCDVVHSFELDWHATVRQPIAAAPDAEKG